MKISVVISTNGTRDLSQCLNSLEKQTYENFEIVLVSNREISEKLDDYDIRYFVSDKKNVSIQRNLGIRKSRGEIVAFIDDDAIAHKNWLENLFKHYENEDIVCVGGKVVPQYEQELSGSVENLEKNILYGLIGATYIKWDEPGEIKLPLIWGCNISFRRNIFDKVGYFPKELGRSEGNLMGGEETYLQIKIMEEDFKIIYEPNAVVEHFISENQLTENYLVKRSFWQGFSEIERLRIAGNFKHLRDFKEELEMIIPVKFLQESYEIWGMNGLKEKIDVARSMGRLFGLKNISKGFVDG